MVIHRFIVDPRILAIYYRRYNLIIRTTNVIALEYGSRIVMR